MQEFLKVARSCLVALPMVALGSASIAETIFSSLGSGDSYDVNSGVWSTSNSYVDPQSRGVFQAFKIAMPTSGRYQLSSVRVPVFLGSGAAVSSFNIDLFADSSGTPGKKLETMNYQGFLDYFGSGSGLISMASSQRSYLEAGKSYWFGISVPPSNPDMLIWSHSLQPKLMSRAIGREGHGFYYFDQSTPIAVDIRANLKPGSVNTNLLLASVAGAVSDTPSTGERLGDVINYMKGPVYADKYAEMQTCIADPQCDIDALNTQRNQEFIDFTQDLAVVGVEVNNSLQGKAISSVAVDTEAWDSLLIVKLKNAADFVDGIKDKLTNAIDLYKTIFPEPEPDPAPAPAPAPETLSSLSGGDSAIPSYVTIRGITGSATWDDDGDSNWLLSDLSIEVEIAKASFSRLSTGQVFGSPEEVTDGAAAFGVFAVGDVVDHLDYFSATISLRQLDTFVSSVPEPRAAALLLIGLGIVASAARRRARELAV